MSKIDFINLNLENFEVYSIPGDAIKTFSIFGLKVNTQLNEHNGISVKFPDGAQCSKLILDLKTKYLDEIPTIVDEDNGEQMMLTHRLIAYHDIVNIECSMDSDFGFNVDLPYKSDMADDNIWMKSKIMTDKDGEKIVHITVKKRN